MPPKLTLDRLLEGFILIHGYKYDYSKVDYINSSIKIDIICEKHGVFKQTPNKHNCGRGCPDCSHTKKLFTEDFIKNAIKIHGYKYDYSKVVYKNNRSKVDIICKDHGIFKQSYSSHVTNKQDCPECVRLNRYLTTDEFIEKSIEVHGDLYSYDNVLYDGYNNRVDIFCKKCDKYFLQSPGNHLNGKGHKDCAVVSKGEKKICDILCLMGIYFDREKKFNGCSDKQHLPFDFYLPDHNICIEYDGEIHYHSIDFFGGEGKLKDRQRKDKIKTDYCIENDINLIRIPYWEYDNIDIILNEIKNP